MEEKRVIPPMDYLESEEKLKMFLDAFPDKREKDRISNTVKAINEVKGTLGLHQAAYEFRMAESLEEILKKLMETSGPVKTFWPYPLPWPKIKNFHLECDNLSGYDPYLGHYLLSFDDAFKIGILGTDYMVLNPKSGGFKAIFADGLPNGSSVYVYLNWTATSRIGYMYFDVSPTNEQISTGTSGPDFYWHKNSPKALDSICIRNNDKEYRVHISADVKIIFY